MNVLLITPSRIVRDIFISELIPRGLTVSWEETIEEAISKVKEKKLSYDVIVVEVISKYDATSFISLIKTILPTSAIVLYAELKNPKEVYDYLKLGVSGFLVKPLDKSSIFKVIEKAYINTKGAPPERKVVRVQFNPGEGSIEFTSSKGIRVIGNIVDLSIGGCAFSYVDKFKEAFSEGEEIKSTRLIFRDSETEVTGVIKTKIPEKNLAVFLFSTLTPDNIQKISKEIFVKTSL
jgi:ActR/RegA family two-component response regulator